MTTGSPSETAKIYAFPARGRFAVRDQRDDSRQPANADLPRGADLARGADVPRGAIVASGAGWYHEEAIQAEQRRKS